jgi:hypothetical protein
MPKSKTLEDYAAAVHAAERRGDSAARENALMQLGACVYALLSVDAHGKHEASEEATAC